MNEEARVCVERMEESDQMERRVILGVLVKSVIRDQRYYTHRHSQTCTNNIHFSCTTGTIWT